MEQPFSVHNKSLASQEGVVHYTKGSLYKVIKPLQVLFVKMKVY